MVLLIWHHAMGIAGDVEVAGIAAQRLTLRPQVSSALQRRLVVKQ